MEANFINTFTKAKALYNNNITLQEENIKI